MSPCQSNNGSLNDCERNERHASLQRGKYNGTSVFTTSNTKLIYVPIPGYTSDAKGYCQPRSGIYKEKKHQMLSTPTKPTSFFERHKTVIIIVGSVIVAICLFFSLFFGLKSSKSVPIPACNGHGALDSFGLCKCDTDHAGKECETAICNGHGNVGVSGICDCVGNWTGNFCWFRVRCL